MKKSIQTPLGVYTDDEVGIEMIESYANQRVIEELEKQVDEYFKPPTEIDLSKRLLSRLLKDRIQELKQK